MARAWIVRAISCNISIVQSTINILSKAYAGRRLCLRESGVGKWNGNKTSKINTGKALVIYYSFATNKLLLCSRVREHFEGRQIITSSCRCVRLPFVPNNMAWWYSFSARKFASFHEPFRSKEGFSVEQKRHGRAFIIRFIFSPFIRSRRGVNTPYHLVKGQNLGIKGTTCDLCIRHRYTVIRQKQRVIDDDKETDEIIKKLHPRRINRSNARATPSRAIE